MHFCSYCDYTAPTNSRWKRHLNTQKHAQNFMLVDAGVQDLVEPPAFDNDNNSHDVPYSDNFCISHDSVTTRSSDIPYIVCDDDDACFEDLPALIDLSTNLENKYYPIDLDVVEMSNTSFGIISSVSRFFTDLPIALRFVQIAGFFGLLWFKPHPTKSSLVESC